MAEKKPPALVIMMSGHCATAHLNRKSDEAHMRCRMPCCPCLCHFQTLPQYECDGGCGFVLVETAWPNPDLADTDEDGNLEPVYIHVQTDEETGLVVRVMGQDCP